MSWNFLCADHRVIILNRGSMFAFQWREFSPPLSSTHTLLQCYHRQKRNCKRYNSRGIPPQHPASRVISQWANSLEWRHTVTLHILVGKICISFFLFYCEGMLSLVVLWLCGAEMFPCENSKTLSVCLSICLSVPREKKSP